MAAIAESSSFESQSRLVVAWRYEELKRAGYGEREAMELALRRDVDLHVALRLLRNGCPVEIAVRILT
jgi:hypothetical protein